MIQVAMDLALITGLSRGDILALTRTNVRDDGIHYTRRKTARRSPRKFVIEWSDELRAVVARAKKIRPQVRQYLVATKQGKQFSTEGFSTAWQRTMVKAMNSGLQQRFHFHDLRAKSASDGADLLESSNRLGHSSPAITQRVYRRKPTRVKPLR